MTLKEKNYFLKLWTAKKSEKRKKSVGLWVILGVLSSFMKAKIWLVNLLALGILVHCKAFEVSKA